MACLYGVPFPPKFNVPFYTVLCTIYPTFCVCHLKLHSRFNVFAFNIQLWLMQHSSFRFRHSTFHEQQSSFLIRSSSSVECTFIFSHPTISIWPSCFRLRHPTLGIVLASFHIQHSTFLTELLPAGQRAMEIVGSIDLTHPSSNGGQELPSGVDLGDLLHSRQTRCQQTCSRQVIKPADRQDAAALLVKARWEPLSWG